MNPAVRFLTMEQFRALKEKENEQEEAWRAEHGWPPLFRKPIEDHREGTQ